VDLDAVVDCGLVFVGEVKRRSVHGPCSLLKYLSWHSSAKDKASDSFHSQGVRHHSQGQV
jgi:hypothetical protein